MKPTASSGFDAENVQCGFVCPNETGIQAFVHIGDGRLVEEIAETLLTFRQRLVRGTQFFLHTRMIGLEGSQSADRRAHLELVDEGGRELRQPAGLGIDEVAWLVVDHAESPEVGATPVSSRERRRRSVPRDPIRVDRR